MMIKINNVSKSFGKVQALKDISFEIKRGEIFGLLGPNGAGKSTTINILNTLVIADAGEVFIDGVNLEVDKENGKLKIGVVPQEIALYEELSAYDNLMFWGGLYNIEKSVLKSKVNRVLELVGLSERKNDDIRTYSGGMKRRINIASSILHDPKILLMDEPTVGVDPQSRNHVFDVIEQLNKEGMTIIYTTHYMEEAERLCDRIAIIDQGTIVAQGTIQELRDYSMVTDILSIELSDVDQNTEMLLNTAFRNSSFDKQSSVLQVECKSIGIEIMDVLEKIKQVGVKVKTINTQSANLESIFLKLTGKQLRD